MLMHNSIVKKCFSIIIVSVMFLNLFIVSAPLVEAPSNSSNTLGYELLDNGSVLRIWNVFNSYYFNVSNGLQFTNHYQKYWTRNVMMLGYYNGDEWVLVYRVDELSGFQKTITLSEDYCNATLWKDLTYYGYSFRVGIRYTLGVNDKDLAVIPFIKNLGANIPFPIGFGWELKDIRINMVYENNFIKINNTMYSLAGDVDYSYTNLTKLVCEYDDVNNTWHNYSVPNPVFILNNTNHYLYLKWDENLVYKVVVKSRDGQYNAPVTLFVKVGTLSSGQEKHTVFRWYDSLMYFSPNSNIIVEYSSLYPSGAPAWSVVDDPPGYLDGDASWIRWGTDVSNKYCIFGIPDVDDSTGIVCTKLKTYMAILPGTSGKYTAYMYFVLRINDTNYLSPVGFRTSSSDWTIFNYTWTLNPATNASWTISDINQLGLGIYVSTGASTISYLSQLYAELDYYTVPAVYTNETKNVRATSATLKGYVARDNNTDVSAYFEYGTTTSYGNTTPIMYPFNEGEEFFYNITGLSPDTLYHYRAVINNTDYIAYGSDKTFVTLPEAPTDVTSTVTGDTIGLSWTKGGAYCTYIERNSTMVTNWSRGEGVVVYNDTGSYFFDTGLALGTRYYYQLWSFSNNSLYSENMSSISNVTYPRSPHGLTGVLVDNYLNFTWTPGAGADTTLVRRKIGGYPTSVNDGLFCQNNSKTYYKELFEFNICYALWSYNSTLKVFSNPTYYAYGGLEVSCYDEKNGNNLTFDIIVSDLTGKNTYSKKGCVNPEIIDIGLCPHGNVMIYIMSEGYQGRTYYKEIYLGKWVVLDAYLTRVTGDKDCELRNYIDSKTVTSYTMDLVIPFTYPLVEMNVVEIYNKTLYGGYGGWLFISADKYSFTTSQIVINKTVLDANITMARVSYLYMYCPGDVVESALYYLRVVETIQTDYSTYDKAVENAFIQVKRMINGTWTLISSLYTDANGYVNLYLIPEVPVKVFISKTGYISTVSDYLPTPPNPYGQTTEKWFRLMKNYTEPPVAGWETLWTNITWSIEPFSSYHEKGFTIFYNITSSDGKIEWFDAYFYFYNSTNFTWFLLYSDNQSNPYGGVISFDVPNVIGKYGLIARFKRINFSMYTFGAAEGCRFYYISTSPLQENVGNIPELIYLFVMIFLMIAATAFLVKFGAGALSGVGGVAVMGFMLALKPGLTIGSPAVSAWWMFLATVIIWLVVLFLSRGRT
ncbi:MAG: hypothetical protein QHH15_00640 [Candidatus Thermoplasmatota archaeon]|nr:hypothetical protein [Candidatus Thermoplasmatota archaeon]